MEGVQELHQGHLGDRCVVDGLLSGLVTRALAWHNLPNHQVAGLAQMGTY